MPLAVTFDFGQTLAELDTDFLARRLAERGVLVTPESLEANVGAAWEVYNQAVLRGEGGHPWHTLMERLLRGAGVPAGVLGATVAWLWSEQPRKNLWRRPIPGMIEIVRRLDAAGTPVGILSNSEGRLADLVGEMGYERLFRVVADSGRLGVEKPDRAIFAWTAEQLGVPMGGVVHVGDSWAADVLGALRAGMRAVWFRGDRTRALDPRARAAATPGELGSVLREWGLG